MSSLRGVAYLTLTDPAARAGGGAMPQLCQEECWGQPHREVRQGIDSTGQASGGDQVHKGRAWHTRCWSACSAGRYSTRCLAANFVEMSASATETGCRFAHVDAELSLVESEKSGQDASRHNTRARCHVCTCAETPHAACIPCASSLTYTEQMSAKL